MLNSAKVSPFLANMTKYDKKEAFFPNLGFKSFEIYEYLNKYMNIWTLTFNCTNLLFLPRATLKGPKRSFVVLVVLGVELGSKNLPNRAKLSKGTKNLLLWHIMVLNCRVCLVWPYVALHGLDVTFHRNDMVGTKNVLLWHIMVLNCRVALYVLVWPFYGLFSRSYIGERCISPTVLYVLLSKSRMYNDISPKSHKIYC